MSGQVQNGPVLQDSQPVEYTSTLPTPVSSQTPQCSGRSTRAPDRYKYLGEVFEVISKTMVEDPTSYKEAMTGVDFYLWQRVMIADMESLYSNQIWDLVDLFLNICCVGY